MLWIILPVLTGGLLGWFWGGASGLLLGGVLAGLSAVLVSLQGRVRELERWVAQLAVEQEQSAPPMPTASQLQPDTPAAEAAAPAALPELELPDLPDAPVPEPAPEPRWQAVLLGWAGDGNLVVRLGLLVLFIGVAFLLKYAAERALFPIELRLAGAALGGMALAGVGWWLRRRRPGFALLLQGGGIGIFYLVIYAATALYGLLPVPLALGLMVALVGLLVALALWQESQGLAAFAIGGGFLAPLLTSTGAGEHVLLFSYYALLNLVVLGLAWYRPWRLLNLLGFAFTFVIATVWGVLEYHPAHYASTQPFLIYFFLLYLSVAVLFALRQPLKLRGYVDATLVFGVPIVAFALQAGLVRHIDYGLAFSALLAGGLYLGLARSLWRREGEGMRLFAEAMLALGVIFATLAIPLALDGRWTAAAWALEGAAMLWVGRHQRRLPVRLFGAGLQVLAGAAFFFSFGYPSSALPVLNSATLGVALLALAGLFSSWQLQRDVTSLHPLERSTHYLWMAWGLLWWLGGGFAEIDTHLAQGEQLAAALLFIGLSSALLLWLWRRLAWPTLRWPLWGNVVLVLLLALAYGEQAFWLYGLGLLAWPLYFAIQYRLLWRLQGGLNAWLQPVVHGVTVSLLALLLAHDAWGWVSAWLGVNSGWAWAAPAIPLLLLLVGLPVLAARLPASWADDYRGPVLLPIALILPLWLLLASSHPATALSLPWLPLLNPLELTQALTLAALALWFAQGEVQRLLHRWQIPLVLPWALWGGLAFVLLNTVLAHAAHHWAGVPWGWRELFASARLQTSFSVAWTLTALGLGWWATRRHWRGLWFVAAGLIGVVVLKLFIIDLADSGTIERIISFIAVGLLMLLMGYLAPLPPRAAEPGRTDRTTEERPQ